MRSRVRVVALISGGLLLLGCTAAVAVAPATDVACTITDNVLSCPLPPPPAPVTETATVTESVTATETAVVTETPAPVTTTVAGPTTTITGPTVTVTAASTATSAAATPTPQPAIANLPGQPGITAYGSATAVTPYAKPGALIIAGRDNYNAQQMKDASAAGATVLIYLDAIIDNPYGRYHGLLVNSSTCGPATARWPGSPKANSSGYLQDFRVGSVVQSKLKCVLELIVAENPHMGGFFADDLGSRSWFPNFSWDSWGATNQQAYRAGAIAVAQTFHDVAVEHGLMLMVNGTWTAGALASNGGGYPTASSHGLSLADGGYIEHHDASELAYWKAYATGQWGTAAGSVSQGKPVMYVQASDDATRTTYNNSGAFSFLSAQASYDSGVTPWGNFHPTGLPSKVTR